MSCGISASHAVNSDQYHWEPGTHACSNTTIAFWKMEYNHQLFMVSLSGLLIALLLLSLWIDKYFRLKICSFLMSACGLKMGGLNTPSLLFAYPPPPPFPPPLFLFYIIFSDSGYLASSHDNYLWLGDVSH